MSTQWTITTLKEHVDSRFLDAEKAVNSAMSAQQAAIAAALIATNTAINKAETATEKRFDSVNEFRGQLRDQADTFIRSTEVHQQFEAMFSRVTKLETSLAGLNGGITTKGAITGPLWAIGGVVFGSAIISVFRILIQYK
jgi:uncharacterized membrane protein